MNCLTFSCDDVNYALNSKEIIEILPLVRFNPLPKTSKRFPGYINYRDDYIPVLDLAVFLGFTPAKHLLSTRLIITNFLRIDGSELLLAVIVENATEMLVFDENEDKSPEIDVVNHPIFSGVYHSNDRDYHLITFRSLKSLQLET